MGRVLAYLIGLIVGLAVVWLLLPRLEQQRSRLRNWLRDLGSQARARLLAWARRALAAIDQQIAAPPASPTPVRALDAPATAEPEPPLAERLQRLEAVYAPTVSGSMHPKELAQQREFRDAVELLKPEHGAARYAAAVCDGRELGARQRGHSRSQGAARRRAGNGTGGGAFRQALPLAHVLCAQVFLRCRQPAAGRRSAGRRQGLVGRQSRAADAVSRLSGGAREARRCAGVRAVGAAGDGIGAGEGLSGARAPPLRDGADRRAAAAAANHARSRFPLLVRALLEGEPRTSTRSSSPSPGGTVWRPRKPPRGRRLPARCWRPATPGSARPRSCGCSPSAWSATGGSCSRPAAPT